MATRNRPISTDSKGRYKSDLGRKLNEVGKLVPHRFLLGTDKATAERSAARLKQLWEAIEATHQPTRLVVETSKAGGMTIQTQRHEPRGPATWGELEMSIAVQVARGEQVIRLEREIADPSEFAAWFNEVANRFPFLVFIPGESAKQTLVEGTAANEALVEAAINETLQRAKSIGRLPAKVRRPGHSLHKALDDYAKDIRTNGLREEDGKLKPSQLGRLDRVKRFKVAHADVPLEELNREAIAGIVSHWRNRPETQRGTRASRHDIRHVLGEWFRFLRWLECADKFNWTMPRGVSSIQRSVPKFDYERTISAVSKKTYNVDQLVELNRHATPLQRLALYVGLNCSMGAAELGRIRLDDITLGQPHPYADRLHFTTSDEDSFVRCLRPKTEVFGEWRLWEPVALMVQWGIDRAKSAKSELLFCYGNGLPIYGRSKNGQQGFANLWSDLLNRVKESDPSFPRLPFGSVRDTFSDLLRHKRSGELASLQLCHGSPCQTDVLLECYSNKPFGSLHSAIAELFDFYRPVFEAVDDPTDTRKRFYSPTKIEKMKSDREAGVPVSRIARKLGVSEMTVRRHTS